MRRTWYRGLGSNQSSQHAPSGRAGGTEGHPDVGSAQKPAISEPLHLLSHFCCGKLQHCKPPETSILSLSQLWVRGRKKKKRVQKTQWFKYGCKTMHTGYVLTDRTKRKTSLRISLHKGTKAILPRFCTSMFIRRCFGLFIREPLERWGIGRMYHITIWHIQPSDEHSNAAHAQLSAHIRVQQLS